MNSHWKLPTSIGIATFFLGWCVWMIAAFRYNAFWYGGGVDYPVIANPSLLIGDALALPFFNAFAARWLFAYGSRKQLSASIWLTILALALSAYQHWIWTTDTTNGLIDPHYTISVVGVWHAIFSGLQLGFILSFLSQWLRVSPNTTAAHEGLRVWYIFYGFAFVSLLDGLLAHYLSGESGSLVLSLVTHPERLYQPVLIVGIGLFAGRRIKKLS